MGFGHGPMDVPGEPPRMGTQRSSQHVNCLLRKSELGKVRTKFPRNVAKFVTWEGGMTCEACEGGKET
jgi:hypothetical protein